MNVFISGGCKNGKTAFALDVAMRLSGDGRRYYAATMLPYDEEDRARIARHIEERAGMGFETLETPRAIASCLRTADPDGTFVIDSVTALLVNEMYPDMRAQMADAQAADRCRAELLQIARNVKNAVFISDYIYADAARYDAFTENFRTSLAIVDRVLAEACDAVIELCAGHVIFHKGGIGF